MFTKVYNHNDNRRSVSALIGGCTFRVLETGMKGFCKQMPRHFPGTKFDTRVPVQRNYALNTPAMQALKEKMGERLEA